ALDPLVVLRGLASLRKLTGSYPAGHPMIGQKLKELEDAIAGLLQASNPIRIDVIRGDVFLDGVASNSENQANQQLISQLSSLGIDSIHVQEGVQRDELLAVAEFLWQYAERAESMTAQLAARNVQHISLGRLLPLDTRWRSPQWADAPTGPLDPDYAEYARGRARQRDARGGLSGVAVAAGARRHVGMAAARQRRRRR